jgi:anti-sigma-K factor RskA
VEAHSLHELTAAYALDALDEHDERAYEEHLRTCEACRAELASFRETAAALAYAAPASAPPPSLRGAMLARARAERSNVLPLGRRWTTPVLGAAAAVAAAVALGLGIWAAALHGDLSGTREALSSERAASRILSDPAAQRTAVSGAEGTLVVTPDGRAVLSLPRIPDAPGGKTYEVWVIEGRTARPAGLFDEPGLVVLDRAVPEGATVGVTVEPAGGVDAPTTAPHITATT